MNRHLFSKFLAVSVGLACIGLAYNHNKSATYELNGSIYGTYWRLVSPEYISDTLNAKVLDELHRIDLLASNYKQESELSLINQSPLGVDLEISKEMHNLLSYAEDVNELSDGFYDITLGSIVSDLGFGTPAISENTQSNISLKRFTLVESAIIRYTNAQLDLSSIAKGYAVDRVAQILIQSGRTNFLFDVGGEIFISGTRHDEPWSIGIQDPLSISYAPIKIIKSINRLAVATSGEYRNYSMQDDGRVLSHTVNPFTETSIDHSVLSVTVTNENSAMHADTWATALNVLGSDRGLQIANEQGLSVMYIIKKGDGMNFLYSDYWGH